MSEQGSSAAPREEEGMQQEFEFGLSGLVDAEYLRQDDQPFKLGMTVFIILCGDLLISVVTIRWRR